jgi:hypothetical protein
MPPGRCPARVPAASPRERSRLPPGIEGRRLACGQVEDQPRVPLDFAKPTAPSPSEASLVVLGHRRVELLDAALRQPARRGGVEHRPRTLASPFREHGNERQPNVGLRRRDRDRRRAHRLSADDREVIAVVAHRRLERLDLRHGDGQGGPDGVVDLQRDALVGVVAAGPNLDHRRLH